MSTGLFLPFLYLRLYRLISSANLIPLSTCVEYPDIHPEHLIQARGWPSVIDSLAIYRGCILGPFSTLWRLFVENMQGILPEGTSRGR